jgi:hypothetical protein
MMGTTKIRVNKEVEVTAYVDVNVVVDATDVLEQISDAELLNLCQERGLAVGAPDASGALSDMIEDLRQAFMLGDRQHFAILLMRMERMPLMRVRIARAEVEAASHE